MKPMQQNALAVAVAAADRDHPSICMKPRWLSPLPTIAVPVQPLLRLPSNHLDLLDRCDPEAGAGFPGWRNRGFSAFISLVVLRLSTEPCGESRGFRLPIRTRSAARTCRSFPGDPFQPELAYSVPLTSSATSLRWCVSRVLIASTATGSAATASLRWLRRRRP
ncbi:hypothetical protein ZIOFF_003093 [Zingiber officinale]|uniref:Uncharacterized protein n=1 Tax=Zingiber officinale TaxID=94328 RepID=A0A8J5M9V9_ZINOF|nr:hypothetical protein ZIOFF_003093 [Zingiber officinale]